jgi:hypothetical protein
MNGPLPPGTTQEPYNMAFPSWVVAPEKQVFKPGVNADENRRHRVPEVKEMGAHISRIGLLYVL